LLSGLSGSGLRSASNFLEDNGYQTVQAYPSELLNNLISLLISEEYQHKKFALIVPIYDFEAYRVLFNEEKLEVCCCLIMASKKTLIKRYKFSRRLHPLVISSQAKTLEEGIDMEMSLFDKYREDAGVVIDTSELNIQQYQNKLQNLIDDNSDELTLSFVSFGFKRGILEDADFIFDVRTLINPFYEEHLRNLTGNDKAVSEYILNSEDTMFYIDKLLAYLDYCFELYAKQDCRHLIIGIGCTGGQHRSVTICNLLYEHYSTKYKCYQKHRELS